MSVPAVLPHQRPAYLGVFGSTEPATWREPFLRRYGAEDIAVLDGTAAADDELRARYLQQARVVLFVVTPDALDFLNLAEIGFVAANLMRASSTQQLVAHISPELVRTLIETMPEQAQASRRARRMVRAWLASLDHPRIHIARSQTEALEVSVALYARLAGK